MNFDLTEERQMLQDGLRRFLAQAATPQAREAAEAASAMVAPDLWSGLAEMGVIGALFTEEQGGFGGAGFDLAVVFEELGRAGAVTPMLEIVLAGGLMAALGGAGQAETLEKVIAGDCMLAFAHGEPASRYDLSRVETTARRDGADYVIDGRKSVVAGGAQADVIVLSARSSGERDDPEGISLFAVPAGSAGLTWRDYPLAGGGRAGELIIEGLRLEEGMRLGAEGAAHDPIETAQARATAALSAEALGLMEAARGLTADYLRTRKQFGQPIGKFQALQHRMADMLIEIEQARSAVINLAGRLELPRRAREINVSATKHLVGRVARHVTEETIQMHGGIGMTEEYELAHLARRLTMTDHRLGDSTYHLGRFVALGAVA